MMLAGTASRAPATTPGLPGIDIVISGRTIVLRRTLAMGQPADPVALDIDTGRPVPAGTTPSPAVAIPSCRSLSEIGIPGKTVCPFAEGVLTVDPIGSGAVLEWRSGTTSWRAIRRSAPAQSHWVIWSASGRLFIGDPFGDVATLECLDHRHGRPVWMYAYSAGPSYSRPGLLEGFAESVHRGEIGTTPLMASPEASPRVRYSGTLVLEP